jgi:poly-beta-1,6-N-acetyl-D-glucosamine synthase
VDDTITCSVGVIAHNCADTIEVLLTELLDQHLHRVAVAEIIVVASGCTDNTVALVQQLIDQHPQLKLVEQPEWRGRADAINLFLAACTTNICVVQHANTLPHEQAVENLVRMFADADIGMVGAQKVLLGTPDYIVGFLTHLRMRMEHLLCLEIPRLSEMVAFRKVFDEIPSDVAMEEAFVEALVVQRGLLVRYAPDAIVYSTAPTSIPAFIAQRRENYVGYLHLQEKYGYTVSSLRGKPVLKAALKEVWGAVQLVWVLFLLAVLEGWSRLLGWYDFAISRERHVVWDMAWTQKQDVQQARRERAQQEGER